MPIDFEETFKQAWKVVTLDEAAMKKIAKDKDALPSALVIIGLFSIISAFGFMLFPPSIFPGLPAFYKPDLVTTIGMAVTTFFLFTATLYVVAYLAEKMFNSSLDTQGFVKILGHGQLVGIVALFPSLAPLAWLWMLVISLYVLNKLAKLDWGSIILLFLFVGIAVLVMKSIVVGIGLPILDYTYNFSNLEQLSVFLDM